MGTAFTRALLAAACMLALALPATALAVPEEEPNDGIHQAFGPVQPDTDYEGQIGSDRERDTFIVYVGGQGNLEVAMTAPKDDICCGDPGMTLRDADGKDLRSVSGEEGTTVRFTYTTPGPGVYYVTIGSGAQAGERYVFRASGPIVNGPRPGPAEPTPNAHHERTSAFGPLDGRLYGGSLDGQREEDWFFFNTRGPGAFDIAMTSLRDDLCCGDPGMTLYTADGTELQSVSGEEDTISHIRYTAPRAARFALRIGTGQAGERYQFFISPGAMLAPTLDPAQSEECQRARTAAAAAQRRYGTARAALRRARSRRARARARRRVARRRAALRRANAARTAACT